MASSPRILILGASGYLGGRIARFLGQQESVRLRFGARKSGSYGFAVRSGDEWATFDLDDAGTFSGAVEGVDTIIHVAGPNAEQSAASADRAMALRGVMTTRLLEAATNAGVRRMIYFSTAHVYGSPLVGELVESAAVQPRHPYAAAHRAAEERVLEAGAKGQLETVVLRLSNALGAPTHANVDAWMLVANDLCRMAVRDRVLVLKTSGLQFRNFIGLDDVERAVLHFFSLERGRLGEGLFNLGGPGAWRVIELTEKIADLCAEALGFRPSIERPAPKPDENPPEHRLAIERLRATGFDPSPSFEAELKKLISFCANQGRA